MNKKKETQKIAIPYAIGKRLLRKALCDLGASFNLMSLSIFRRLGLGDISPTTVTLQLVDHSITYLKGVIEDVLVKLNKFIFPMDFIILDMEEVNKTPIILGRPFLDTGRTFIDVQKGELTMRVSDQEVTFNIAKSMRKPAKEQDTECFSMDIN